MRLDPRVALPLESVPNVSEGRDPAAIDAIGEAFTASARLLDVHSDPTTIARCSRSSGTTTLVESLVAGVARAVELVDLRAHQGAHPRRRGRRRAARAPGRRTSRARAAALALADRLGGLGLPVLFYGRLTEDGRAGVLPRRRDRGARAAARDRRARPRPRARRCIRPRAPCSSAFAGR